MRDTYMDCPDRERAQWWGDVVNELGKELPLQMLASVGRYGFWTHYFYSGDAETMRDVYPRVKDYLESTEFSVTSGLIIRSSV